MAGTRPAGQINKVQFIREVLRKNPRAKPADVEKAWRAAGHEAHLNQTLYYQVKKSMGLAKKRSSSAASTPDRDESPTGTQPAGYVNKSAFIREVLRKNPDAKAADVNEAWSAAGNRERLNPALYYGVKRSMELGETRASFTAPTARNDESSAGNALGWTGTFEERLSTLRNLIDREITVHGPRLANHGRRYLWNVREFEWCDGDQSITCDVDGDSATPYEVTIELPQYADDRLDAYCSCPYSDDVDYCKHTYAALERLNRYLLERDRRFARIVLGGASAERWRESLAELDRFVEALQSASKSPADADQRRLVWRIGLSKWDRAPEIEAYEQKVGRKGKWTSGRRLVMDGLVHDSVHAADPSNRAVLDVLRSRYRRYGYVSSYDLAFDLIESLVGHPNVYWADHHARKLEVRAGKFGLAVDRTDEGYRLVPTLDDVPLATDENVRFQQQRGAIAIDRDASRITVARANATVGRLLGGFLESKPTVPEAHKSLLLDRLARVEPSLPVTLPESLAGPIEQADPRVALQLAAIEPEGLTVDVRVRPAPDAEALEPGVGAEKLTLLRDGSPVRVARDLQAERTRCEVVVGSIELDGAHKVGRWGWRIASDEAALDLIANLREHASEDVVVEWPEGEPVSVIGTASPSALRVEIRDRRDWFGLGGSLEIDGAVIELTDLLSAVRAGQRYVEVGDGKWARIEEGFRARLAALDDIAHPTRSGDLQLGATALPVIGDLLDDDVALKASRKWNRMVERLETIDDKSVTPPVTFQAELRDYQLDGFRWLRRLATWGVGACLADDMGLGKTIQTLALLVDRAECGPALVVAPTSVGFNWVDETERFAPTLRPILHRETDRDSDLDALEDGDLLITSYGLLRRDADKLAERQWGTLVIDEAQFVKNSVTKAAQAVRRIEADWRLALTGTPLENHLGELWSIFRALSPGLFGSWDRFKDRFADPIEKNQDAERRHALSRTIRPFMLRRNKAEVLSELPSRTEDLRVTELSAAERRRYEDERLRALVSLADDGTGEDARFKVLAALTRLRQLACHPGLVDPTWKESSAKLDLLIELVDELREGGHRALVFSQFVQHLSLIRRALDARGVGYQYLDGKTTAKQRKERVTAFQKGEGELFLISLKAGGTGLNLTGADYVIHMDPWWNPAVEDQATDRAHRIGQTRPVTVYRLVAKDTIEEQILALHADKRHLIAGILDGTDQAAKLSTGELVSLIRTGGRNQAPTESPRRKNGASS